MVDVVVLSLGVAEGVVGILLRVITILLLLLLLLLLFHVTCSIVDVCGSGDDVVDGPLDSRGWRSSKEGELRFTEPSF